MTYFCQISLCVWIQVFLEHWSFVKLLNKESREGGSKDQTWAILDSQTANYGNSQNCHEFEITLGGKCKMKQPKDLTYFSRVHLCVWMQWFWSLSIV